MKKLILLTGLISLNLSFAQLTKIETHESQKMNIIEKDGKQLASSEIYKDRVEIVFYESTVGADLFFDLTVEEFRQVGEILQSYKARDKDFYTLKIARGMLFIRFTERNGYVQSEIYMDFEKSIWYFPKMNRIQYKRLFSM